MTDSYSLLQSASEPATGQPTTRCIPPQYTCLKKTLTFRNSTSCLFKQLELSLETLLQSGNNSNASSGWQLLQFVASLTCLFDRSWITAPASQRKYPAASRVVHCMQPWNAPRSSRGSFADVMGNNPGTYDKSYFWSYLYVFTLTMPNAVTVYHTYGMEVSDNANSFALFDRSVYWDIGIVMMSLHQAVAFGLFAGPPFHMFEKLIHIHDWPFTYRAFARLPLCGLIVLIAVCGFSVLWRNQRCSGGLHYVFWNLHHSGCRLQSCLLITKMRIPWSKSHSSN